MHAAVEQVAHHALHAVRSITPPMGMVLFIVTRTAKIRFETLARAFVPWLVPRLVVLIAVAVYLPFTLWSPRVVKGG